MNIIKLDAIHSTNDYLKSLVQKQFVENLTVITAEHQFNGRGQMGSQWLVEQGKNLTFSVLVKDLLLDINAIFHLNVAVAVSIIETLSILKIDNLAIKWPNDILAGNKKVGGILIENMIRNGGEIFSIVGIGINVNQQDFNHLPQAGSLLTVTGVEFDKTKLMLELLHNLGRNISSVMNENTTLIWNKYHQYLYKKNIPMAFETLDGQKVMGIIQGVNNFGKLVVLLADDTIKHYNIKEIKMLY
ncbi:biotin--[acetyl-CoA-carboxylase] ligase [Flavobacterium sp. NST-5]|uniref:Biotin--[acetyl-CoA-carboxylase] ligase n=1 Tax=Flavobacterium ichthyis TaxID=2698827 RepID=A0ABW9Z8U5_9FLAO|nr:biotin--[acetyl-CoA-carboxylase] ligase [Flavobacterium ichthyis]NBL65303.1 biotin--[acetyl-CoA-carboxylase] ligase [Flavobacterium ichthyis]